jgi:hypothetical protein
MLYFQSSAAHPQAAAIKAVQASAKNSALSPHTGTQPPRNLAPRCINTGELQCFRFRGKPWPDESNFPACARFAVQNSRTIAILALRLFTESKP